MAPSLRIFVSSVLLLLLIRSSCAWAVVGRRDADLAGGNGRRGIPPVEPPPVWRRLGAELLSELDDMVEDMLVKGRRRHPAGSQHSIAGAAVAAPPKTTPQAQLPVCALHSHSKRDDQGQIDQLSASVQQFSQASQQLSQSLQQATQSLQQAQQSASRFSSSAQSASQASQQASQQAQQMSQSAQQASQQASQQVSQASSSASSAIASAQSSAASSASAAIAANLASATKSIGASASSLMAAASSMIQSAQAQATAIREQADTEVTQAQGNAVSVTQAALAIVGAVVGSSLLTFISFWLVLRYRRNRDRRSRAYMTGGDRRRPSQSSGMYAVTDEKTNGQRPPSASSSVYSWPEKRPPATVVAKAVDAPSRTVILQPAPTARRGVGAAAAAGGGGAGGGSFSTFRRPGAMQDKAGESSSFPSGKDKQKLSPSRTTGTPLGLDTWLKAGKVSPFGTLRRQSPSGQDDVVKKANWPLELAAKRLGRGAGP